MATSVQTSYGSAPAAAVAGQLADESARSVMSAANSAATGPVAGQLVIRGTADGLCRPLAVGDVVTADADAIALADASATTKQIISGAGLDGVIGATAFWPPLTVTATFNSHSDWNDTDFIVRGLDAFGEPAMDVLKIPEGGNVTVTGSVAFSKITSYEIPPATSTNGTVTVGLSAAMGAIDRKVYGVALYDATREPEAYQQYEDVPVLRKGRVYVTAEGSVAKGDPVYVRFVVSGSEVYGGLSNAPDANDCALLAGARWGSTRTGAGLAILELDLPGS